MTRRIVSTPRIAFIIYRRWAFDICVELTKTEIQCTIPLVCTTKSAEFDASELPKDIDFYCFDGKDMKYFAQLFEQYNIDVACFFGWSHIVDHSLYEQYLCLCIHPSRLPEFRGGSPLQHQIMSGIVDSGVTVFRIGKGIDAGDIFSQSYLSLRGELSEIFSRITRAGIRAMQQFVHDYNQNHLLFMPQNYLEKYPPYKRRKQEESEITINKLINMSRVDFINFVRALADPYPNAFIRTENGQIILIKRIVPARTARSNAKLLNNLPSILPISLNDILDIHFYDGYAHVIEYKII